MPTYDYRCKKCGKIFEKFQNMSDEHLKKCPECGSPIERLIGTGAGIIFKGSGFYETDYRKESYKKAEKADKSSSFDSVAKKSKDTPKETVSSK
jgi:putative FmdB family regulatory protein